MQKKSAKSQQAVILFTGIVRRTRCCELSKSYVNQWRAFLRSCECLLLTHALLSPSRRVLEKCGHHQVLPCLEDKNVSGVDREIKVKEQKHCIFDHTWRTRSIIVLSQCLPLSHSALKLNDVFVASSSKSVLRGKVRVELLDVAGLVKGEKAVV